MTAVQANGITIEFETHGDPQNEPMLMVMGHGAQLIYWPPAFLQGLVEEGYFVITYDNRDVGKSTHFPLGTTYTVSDMSNDGMALLDHLGIDSAHIVGASMGGGIVQVMAIEHPERVRSMCSIMSTTSGPGLPPPPAEVLQTMLAMQAEPVDTRDAFVEQAMKTARIVGSTGFDFEPDWIRTRSELTYDRGYHPDGRTNQSMAIAMTPDRTEALRSVTAPTVVIHGTVDPLVHPMGGELTANAVPGAELVMIEGMGHDLPSGVFQTVTEAIVKNARKAVSA